MPQRFKEIRAAVDAVFDELKRTTDRPRRIELLRSLRDLIVQVDARIEEELLAKNSYAVAERTENGPSKPQ